MEKRWRNLSAGQKALIVCALLTLLAGILLFAALGRSPLWEDEAETAVVARNVLTHGYPTPWDGAHLVTQQGGRDILRVHDKLLWAWHPWLQHYLCAASFAAFDEGTLQARLPFALIALLSVPVFFYWRFRRNTLLASALATLVYATSLTFLLFSRQCRYYPLLFLGGILALWQYELLLVKTPRLPTRAIVYLGLSLALVFYGNPLSGVMLALGLLAHAWFWQGRSPRALVRTFAACGVMGLVAAPWLLMMLLAHIEAVGVSLAARVAMVLGQSWRFQYSILPAITWPLLAWYAWKLRKSPKENRFVEENSLMVVLAATGILVSAAVAPLGSVRYLLYLLPLGSALLVDLWDQLNVWSPAAAACVLALCLCTNILPAAPAIPFALAHARAASGTTGGDSGGKLVRLGRLNSPPLLYLYELLHPSPGPVSVLVGALGRLPRRPRLILTDYSWESLNFYLRVPVVGHGDEEAARARLHLPPVDLKKVDVFCQRYSRAKLPGGFANNPDFTVLHAAGPDYRYENLPDPISHRFGEPPAPPLIIYVRKSLVGDQGSDSFPRL